MHRIITVLTFSFQFNATLLYLAAILETNLCWWLWRKNKH